MQLPPLAPHLWEAVCHDNQQHEREIAAGPSKTPAVGAGGGSLFSAPNNQMLNSPAFQALMTQFQSSSGAVSVQAPKPVKLAKAGEKAPTNEQLKAAIYLAAQSQAAGGAVGGIDATPTTTHHVSFEQLLKQQAQPFTVHKSPAAGPLTISAGKVSKPPKAALGAIRTAPASGAGRVRGPKGDTHDNDVLEMPCFRFNQYIKEHGLSDKEVKEMKEARRRMKNRLYGNPKPTISSLHPHTDERQAPRQQSRTRTRPSAPLCTSPPTSHPASAAVDHVPMLGKEVFSTIRGSGSDSP